MTEMNLQTPAEMPDRYASLAERLTGAVYDATIRWPLITRTQVSNVITEEINKALPLEDAQRA
jgi:hypothetical protein